MPQTVRLDLSFLLRNKRSSLMVPKYFTAFPVGVCRVPQRVAPISAFLPSSNLFD